MKGIALFPGGFKPPHRSHLQAIEYLCARPDIDEVRVIVSNRARLLPGTHLALSGETCVDCFRMLLKMLKPRKPVIVELAEHRAVEHALAYAEHAPADHGLWFCLGEEDASRGDPRYVDLGARGADGGALCRELVLPKTEPIIRASQVRALLSGQVLAGKLLAGQALDDHFSELLPPELSLAARRCYWRRLHASVEPIASIVQRKLASILHATDYQNYQLLRALDSTSSDPNFRLVTETGAVRILKYAGDTVATGSFFDATQPLPPRRLAVERRALKALASQNSQGSWRTARVEYWNKPYRLLALEEPGGVRASSLLIKQETASLSRALEARAMVQAAGKFLAELHGFETYKEPLWGPEDEERAHWQSCLVNLVEPEQHRIAKPRKTFLHLNFTPDMLYWKGGALGVTNFERASRYGDPALDLALFIDGCLRDGADSMLVDDFLTAYFTALKPAQHSSDPDLQARALTFAQHWHIRGREDYALSCI